MRFEKEVAAGAAWLDKVRPGWINKINVKELNSGCGGKCVMGQIFSTRDAINICDDAPHFSIEHGFFVAPIGFYGRSEKTVAKEYKTLSNQWIKQIKNRRVKLEIKEAA